MVAADPGKPVADDGRGGSDGGEDGVGVANGGEVSAFGGV